MLKSETINLLKKFKMIDEKSNNILKRIEEINVNYINLDGKYCGDGKILVMDAVSENVKNIFNELVKIDFRIAKIDPFDGNVIKNKFPFRKITELDDNCNSTRSFCYRKNISNNKLSLHSFGLAIDINPLFNPCIKIDMKNKKITEVIPKNGIFYLNRSENRPNKEKRYGIVDQEVVEIFKKNEFNVWGGNWDFPLDYHHFEVSKETLNALKIVDFEN